MKVREIYEACYPLLNKHWITYALWTNWFLMTLESALHNIETYEWRLWKWQHYSEQIEDLWTFKDRWFIRHQTDYPILKVDRFWWWKDKSIDEYLALCNCPEEEEEEHCHCKSACIQSCLCFCDPLKMEEVLPHTKMCPGNYRVAASSVLWMWWEWWDVLHILPAAIPPKMFVTYYRWFEPVTSFDQEIYIPRHFINAIKYAIMMDVFVWKWVWWESLLTYFEEKYDKAMNSLKKTDTVLWNNFVRWQNDQHERYPFYGDEKSTVTNVY